MANRCARVCILSFIMFIGLFVLQGCRSSGETHGDEKAAGDTTSKIETFSLKRAPLSSSIRIPGELIAFQQVDIYAKVNGFIKRLYVDVGSQVKEGQLLATLEAPELHSQFLGATSRLKAQEATYLSSEATYQRLLETSKTPGTVSQNDLDLALAKRDADLAQLEAVKAMQHEVNDMRAYLEIKAPFSGVISSRNVSTGSYVGPSGRGSEWPIFTLQEQQRLRLVVSVPQNQVSSLNLDSNVTFAVKSLPGQRFGAKVARLAGALDAQLRSQRTEMDVFNTDRQLLPGMIAEVHLPLNGHPNAFAVPSSAVLNSTRGVFVIKVVNGKVVWTPVEMGHSTAESVEIFGDNIGEGDVLVKVASEEIRNNDSLATANVTTN